jgi:uncharacterized phage-like protein YoqJ
MFGLLNLLQDIDILCIQRLNHESKESQQMEGDNAFLRATLQSVNLWRWATVTIFHGNAQLCISLDFRHESNITPRMNAVMHAVEQQLNVRPTLLRFVFSTGSQVDWFNGFLQKWITERKLNLSHCLMQFVIQPNLLRKEMKWTSLTDAKGRLPGLLFAIKSSFHKQDKGWMQQRPVQIAERYVTNGYHAYITMPDSSKGNMVEREGVLGQRILCDNRIFENAEINEMMESSMPKAIITLEMEASMYAVQRKLAVRPTLLRFVFSTGSQVDWFNGLLQEWITQKKFKLSNCLMHFVIEPNLLRKEMKWTSSTDAMGRFPGLLFAIQSSFHEQNSNWMQERPVQIAEGYVTKGYHAYITMPDSSRDKMVKRVASGQKILCDKRIFENAQITEAMQRFTTKVRTARVHEM